MRTAEMRRVAVRSLAVATVLAGACQGPPSRLGEGLPPVSVTCPGDTDISGEPALPRNVIFLMGDGMGPEQVRAGAIARGAPLAMTTELWGPVYVNTDSKTTDGTLDPDTAPTDSAAGATAIATGVRTLNGRIGLDPDGDPVESVTEIARASGKAVGIVTTTFVYDASPAAFISHAASRYDTETIVTGALGGVRPDVWLGAGQSVFDADDGALAALAGDEGYAIVRDADALAAWDPAAGSRVLGLFPEAQAPVPGVYDWGLTPVVLRTAESRDPRLPVMVGRALDRLEDAPNGFFLFVEDEHTDTLGHVALIAPQTSVDGIPLEVVELDEAVRAVLDWVAANSSWSETLVVVGADHETGGYVFAGGVPSTAQFPAAPLHTRRPIAVYAAGPGSDRLDSLCRTSDLFLLLTGRLPAP